MVKATFIVVKFSIKLCLQKMDRPVFIMLARLSWFIRFIKTPIILFYINKQTLFARFLIGLWILALITSSNTSCKFSWVRAEHSKYFTALMVLAIFSPSPLATSWERNEKKKLTPSATNFAIYFIPCQVKVEHCIYSNSLILFEIVSPVSLTTNKVKKKKKEY